MGAPINELDYSKWEMYLSDLRALSEDGKYKVFPTLSDYNVWLQDNDFDDYEPAEGYER